MVCGPELTAVYDLFSRWITIREGSMVLKDANGLVVDSLNYGGLVDPWAAQGYQATSGAGKNGCYVPAPSPVGLTPGGNMSAGRFPDGADTGSNCNDFVTQGFATLLTATTAGERT